MALVVKGDFARRLYKEAAVEIFPILLDQHASDNRHIEVGAPLSDCVDSLLTVVRGHLLDKRLVLNKSGAEKFGQYKDVGTGLKVPETVMHHGHVAVIIAPCDGEREHRYVDPVVHGSILFNRNYDGPTVNLSGYLPV